MSLLLVKKGWTSVLVWFPPDENVNQWSVMETAVSVLFKCMNHLKVPQQGVCVCVGSCTRKNVTSSTRWKSTLLLRQEKLNSANMPFLILFSWNNVNLRRLNGWLEKEDWWGSSSNSIVKWTQALNVSRRRGEKHIWPLKTHFFLHLSGYLCSTFTLFIWLHSVSFLFFRLLCIIFAFLCVEHTLLLQCTNDTFKFNVGFTSH